MRIFFLSLFSLVLWSACDKAPAPEQEVLKSNYYSTDSLLDKQLELLVSNSASLHKTHTFVDGQTDLEIAPDSSQWQHALSVLHALDINKPSLIDAYEIEDHIADSSSNLVILQYRLKDDRQPLKEVNFYYLRSIKNLKKITAKSSTHSFVSDIHRFYELSFSESADLASLEKWSISTTQKTLFRDSVYDNIDFNIIY